MTGFLSDTAEQSLMRNDVLCSGLVDERIWRAVAGRVRRQGSAIIHAILPIVGVAVLVDAAVLIAVVLEEYLVTGLGRCEVLGRPWVHCKVGQGGSDIW